MLDGTSPLITSKLVVYDDPDEDFEDRSLVLDPSLTEALLEGGQSVKNGWDVSSEEEFFNKLASFTRAMKIRMDAVDYQRNFGNNHADLFKADRRHTRIFNKVRETLEQHQSWKIPKFFAAIDIYFSDISSDYQWKRQKSERDKTI